ncbi:cytochrome P450 [Aspergillus affinis]|uniref:cytochrome P450 n=1 Tax=Aspergillus affinis TaxID=1070780 RepID=UPI0022FE28E0|nr:cytochrome P450 [Aspergillus affinis]KAI9035181.1 cytochrome P450 [Aspergillus affinis]
MTPETDFAPTWLSLLLKSVSRPGAWAMIAIVGFVFVLVPYMSRRDSHARFAHTQGCQTPTRYAHRDPLLGLDALQDSLQARRRGQYFRREQRLHQAYGNTFMSLLLGSWTVNTIEPQNLEALFSTKFSDYEVDSAGETPSPHCWICFSKAQTSQLELLERHIQNLLIGHSAANSGKAINLALYFHRFAADV